MVPVTFAMDGDLIYTVVDHKPKKSVDLRGLGNIRENPRVALLVDQYTEDWDALWWVRVDGWASVVDDERGLQDPLDVLAERYRAVPGAHQQAGPVIVIQVDHWKGWSEQVDAGLALGPPAAVEVGQVRSHPPVSGLPARREPTGQPDRLPHLGEVLGAVRAGRPGALRTCGAPPGTARPPGSRSPTRRPPGTTSPGERDERKERKRKRRNPDMKLIAAHLPAPFRVPA